MSKAIKKLQSLMGGADKLVLQGGSKLHDHGDVPTVFLRETKKHRKVTRKVVAVLSSTAEGKVVKDHCGEVWTAKQLADGNYRAII